MMGSITEIEESNVETDNKPQSADDKVPEPPTEKVFSVSYDRLFPSWHNQKKCTILVTSYQSNFVYSLGIEETAPDTIKIFPLPVMRPMGIHGDNKTIWVTQTGNIFRYENVGEQETSGHKHQTYIPQQVFLSADVDIHDLVSCGDEVWYCSTKFSAVCKPSATKTFEVYWTPPWVTRCDVPEDRCHLNGLCLRDGRPRYVSAAGKTDFRDSWRENRGEGLIYDIVEDKEVCVNMWMPHSPRWYQNKLWALEAGTGYFGYVDFDTKKFVQKVFIPGFLRGLSFVDNYALIGSSLNRGDATFHGMPLTDKLTELKIRPRCGVTVINLTTFGAEHWLEFSDAVTELYDVHIIPNQSMTRLMHVTEPILNTSYYF